MKKKQKAETKSRRKSSGGLTFSEKKRLVELKHILSGKGNQEVKSSYFQYPENEDRGAEKSSTKRL